MSEYVRLGDIGEIITGNTPKTSDENNYSSNDICFVKPSDLSDNDITEINKTDFYISEFAREKARILPVDSVLVSCIGIIGKVGITKKECAFNQQINAIIPNLSICMAKYLAYLIQFQKKKIQAIANAPVVPILNKTQFSDITILVPNLTEQQYVIGRLDAVTTLIDKHKKQLEKLDELVKARFVEMFGDPKLNECAWEQTTLKDIAVGKLSYGSGASAVDYNGSIRYVRITDILDNGELNEDIKSPSEIDNKYLLNNGDILFARSGATVGKTFKYSKEKHGKCLYAGYLIRLIPNQTKVIPDYVFYFTKTYYYQSFIKNAQRAVAQPNINAQEYGNLTICVPPIELQNQFADFVKQVEKTKTQVQKSLEQAETLKKALMQKYFG